MTFAARSRRAIISKFDGGPLAEMAPVGGNDEQHAGHCKCCAGDDRSNPTEPQGWNFGCNEPDTCDQDEKKPEFGQLQPC
jgi:hypothetical protein